MRVVYTRVLLIVVAASEFAWAALFYLRPEAALSSLGRGVVDPVMARQYPLYLASTALAYAIAAANPARYRGVLWICFAQRATELVAALIDWRGNAIATPAFLRLALIEAGVGVALVIALGARETSGQRETNVDPRDRGLVRLLRGFGGLEVFWFLASTIFVQLGSRLLHWKLQDAYTTQQQGIALLIIGLTSLLAASDVARYRALVWVPVASQLIGIANSFNEIRLGSIGWSAAAVQWAIELSFAGAFFYFSRHRMGFPERARGRSAFSQE